MPILLDPARHKVVVCGRRWGKSALGLLACLRGHGPRRGFRKGANDGGKVWWVAPDYPTASEIWRDLKKATRKAWVEKDEVERRIQLPSGGSVSVRSAHDPETLVAVGLDGIVFDECAKANALAWHQSLRPTLSDTQGWAVFISTPKGHNWFYDLFVHAGRTPNWSRWQRPTSDNPLIPAQELEDARRDAPRHFAQEYLASFASPEGAEWPAEYFPESLWFTDYPERFAVTALALDPAQGKGEKKKGCYSTFALVCVDPQGVAWCEAWMSQQWDASQLVEQAFALTAAARPMAMSVELNGGQSFLASMLLKESRLRRKDLPLFGITNAVEKEVRIRSGLGPLLSQGRLRFRDTPGTRTLLQQTRDFPVGEFMDGPDALEIDRKSVV